MKMRKKALSYQCVKESGRGSYETQKQENEREKAGEKGRKKSRKKHDIIFIKNKVVVKKVEN